MGNGFIKKIPTLKENLNNYLSQEREYTLSIEVRENQESSGHRYQLSTLN